MLAQELYKFRDYLHEQGIVFCYSGFMTESVLTGIGNAVKRKLEIEEADRQTAKGVFSVFVEQVQNVIRYSAEREPPVPAVSANELRYGVLTVGRTEDRYFVSCGNLIRNDDLDRLDAQLHHIQTLDKDGLKALYKETLKGEVPEGSKGAGVGFIDIARRATHGFEFDFTKVDDSHSFFCLRAYV